MLGPLPEVYAKTKPLHDDWPWPLSLIPRKWTGRGLAMPPKQIAGTAPLGFHEVQLAYPLAPVQTIRGALTQNGFETRPNGSPFVCAPDPVPKIGTWSVQACWSQTFKAWIPCYVAGTFMVFGRRLHFNGCVKPDLTLGDWYWWFEFSLTWIKI